MTKLKINIKWLDKLLPEGIAVPSSTLISGPGGTGKPLVEFAFVSAWLKAGGSLIGIPLQYPTVDLMQTAMYKLYNLDLKNYHGRKLDYIIALGTHRPLSDEEINKRVGISDKAIPRSAEYAF